MARAGCRSPCSWSASRSASRCCSVPATAMRRPMHGVRSARRWWHDKPCRFTPPGHAALQRAEGRMNPLLPAPAARPPARMVGGRLPVLDAAPFLRGEPGALEALAAELRFALENVGFYLLAGHGIEDGLIERTYAAAKRFHGQPLEAKLKVRIDEHNLGYMPIRGSLNRTSIYNTNAKPSVNEAFFLRRQRTPDDPDVIANKPLRGLNQWPEA